MDELETAYEELRVADEEMRTQQQEIEDLLRLHRGRHAQDERISCMMPTPALLTDSAGIIATSTPSTGRD